VKAAAGDLHLVPSASAVIDKVTVRTSAPFDWDGQSRPIGASADFGAEEFSASAPPGHAGQRSRHRRLTDVPAEVGGLLPD